MSSTPTAPMSPKMSSVRSWPTSTRPTRTRFPSSVSAHSLVVASPLVSPLSTTPTRLWRSSSLTTVSSVSVPPPRLRRPADSNVRLFLYKLDNKVLTHHRQTTQEPFQEVPWYRQDQGSQEEQGLNHSFAGVMMVIQKRALIIALNLRNLGINYYSFYWLQQQTLHFLSEFLICSCYILGQVQGNQCIVPFFCKVCCVCTVQSTRKRKEQKEYKTRIPFTSSVLPVDLWAFEYNTRLLSSLGSVLPLNSDSVERHSSI